MSATGISKEIETAGQLEELRQEVRIAAEELLSAANMKPGQILVVGCSSSEIASHKIGSYSSAEIGKAVFEELYAVTKSQGLYLAAQCCEHLNRALIVEEEAAEKYGLEMVNVVPQLKAGGSFATAAYAGFDHPTAVERIQAHAGIDIETLSSVCTCARLQFRCGPRSVRSAAPCDVCENEAEIYWRRAGALSGCEIKKMRSKKKRGNQEK